MPTVIIEPPAADTWPIDLADAKRHLRIEADDTSQDDWLKGAIAAATAPLDGPDGWLGRALLAQTLEQRLDGFSPCPIVLRCPPLLLDGDGAPANLVVRYLDRDGVLQTVASSDYRVIGGGENPARLVLAAGRSWPATRGDAECVRIEFDAGYGTAPASVAPEIRHAIRLAVAHLDAHREGDALDGLMAIYQRLLSHKRVFV